MRRWQGIQNRQKCQNIKGEIFQMRLCKYVKMSRDDIRTVIFFAKFSFDFAHILDIVYAT